MNDNKKDNKKKLVLAAIALLLLIGIGSVVVMNDNKEDENLQASNNIEETQEVESSIIEETKEIESSEVVESTETVESVPETVETEVIETTEVSTTIEETEVAATPEPEERLYDDSYYDENGNFNPYTDEVAAPYEGSSSNSVTIPDTSNVEYALPYIVNGIDIRNGDVDGDGISDNHQNTWWNGVTWTSSAGYVLRVADGFEIYPGNMNVYSVFIDGTEDLRPGSDFMLAYNEFTGRAYKTQISAADLPNVVPVSTKQITINESYPSFVAYKKAFDPLWQKQNGANLAQLQPYDANQDGIIDGIGLLSLLDGSGYMWQMDYKADKGYWVLTIKSNYTELIWDSIHNSISMITPDADQVYTEIYNGFYSDNSVLVQNYQSWVQIGNTNVMATGNGNGSTYIMIK